MMFMCCVITIIFNQLQGDHKKCDETIFFLLILRAINAIEILKNRMLLFVLTRHFKRLGKEEFLIINGSEN